VSTTRRPPEHAAGAPGAAPTGLIADTPAPAPTGLAADTPAPAPTGLAADTPAAVPFGFVVTFACPGRYPLPCQHPARAGMTDTFAVS
jgi:hypothetical protein